MSSKPLADNATSKPKDFDIVGTVGKGIDKTRKFVSKFTKLTDYYDVDKWQVFAVVAWLSGATLLGWRAFHMYHGDLDQDCFVGTFNPPGYLLMDTATQTNANTCGVLVNGTSVCGAALKAYADNEAPSCNPYGDTYYAALGIAGLMVFGYVYESFCNQKAIQMPFSTATWEFNYSMFSLSDKVEIQDIRMWHYFGHTLSAVAFFIMWYYIDNDSVESKALVHEATRSLTGSVRAWMVIVPTVMAEIGTIKVHNLSREQWKENHMGWAAMSILNKFVMMLVLHFILDPQTQLLWLHKDESDGQRNWVIGITSAVAFMVAWFWYKFLQRRYVEYQQEDNVDQISRLQNRLWAYVDFPTNLTMVAMIAYNVTARLRNEHGITHLPADFHAGMLYLILVAVGIHNIPVTHVEAEWTPDSQNARGADNSASRIVSHEVCMINMKKNMPVLKAPEEVLAAHKDGDGM